MGSFGMMGDVVMYRLPWATRPAVVVSPSRGLAAAGGYETLNLHVFLDPANDLTSERTSQLSQGLGVGGVWVGAVFGAPSVAQGDGVGQWDWNDDQLVPDPDVLEHEEPESTSDLFERPADLDADVTDDGEAIETEEV